MASKLYYDIKATMHFNEFDLDSMDEDALAFHRQSFDAVNIGLFIQTKTFMGTREPLAQLVLNQIPESLVADLNSNAYYLEISIFQDKVEKYRNFYKIVHIESNATDQVARLGADLVNANIILKSMLMTNIEKDKSLTDVQVEIQSEVGYIKAKDLIYDKMPASLINTYGTGFQVYNRINKNINTTGYKELAFPANSSNLDSIAYMHKHYPVSLNHCLYGFDEGFDSSDTKNITELVTVDIADPDSWLNVNSECISFERDPGVPVQSQPTVYLEGPYFPSTFSDKYITSRKRVLNTIDSSTYDIEPLSGEVTRVPVFNKNEDGFSSISGSTKENSSLEFVETTLSDIDYVLQQEALVVLYSKNPLIYNVSFGSGCPYDMGRLGRKTNLPPAENNITISADIRFLPFPNEKDVQQLKETAEKTDPFLCTMDIQTLSY